MADDMDSDSCVGFKRTIKAIEETQSLPQPPSSPSVIPEQDRHSSAIVSPPSQDSDSSKKVRLSPHGQVSETHLEEAQEMPDSLSAKAKACDFVSGFSLSDGVAQDSMGSCEVGSVSDAEKTLDDEKERVFSGFVDKKGDGFVTSEVGFVSDVELVKTEAGKALDDEKDRAFSGFIDKKGEGFVKSEVGFAESDCKQGLDAAFVENKAVFHGKEAESQSFLELKKKQLLEEVEAIFVPAEKTHDGSVNSFKIDVIDDTALIETINVPKPGNGCGKELGFSGPAKCAAQRNGNKNAKIEMNGKKAKTSGRKENVANHSLSLKSRNGTKIMYSRLELEAVRFVNVAEQKNLWKDIYRGFGPVVAKEYDNLASVKNQKNIHNKVEPQKRFEKMEVAPGVLGEAFSGNVDFELENLLNNETQDASPLDPFCSYSATDEGGYPFPERECSSEDDDSDEDYASIQRPAFVVEGEPNFDSGSPEDGLEYLRRVRWEAARIPKVRVAKLDRSKFNTEQSAYMPKIPEISKCPEQLLPQKQWEDAFLAEFSELRLALSRFEDSNASTSQDPQSKLILNENCFSHQLPGHTANVKSKEIDIARPHDCSLPGSSVDQPSSSNTEGSNDTLPAKNSCLKSYANQSSGNLPLLSVISRMDSVARVSMLRKRIKAVEDASTLSRNDSLWLYALCAVVDTPLDADTSASLRSLLRKCAALRAAKSALDDEVVMLNILATISGRYFGQSEN